MPVDPPLSALRSLRIHVDQEGAEWRHQLAATAAQVTELTETVERLAKTAGEQAPAGAIWWPDLDEAEGSRRWSELETWVEGVFRARYPVAARRLPDCWDEHPAMIDAITAGWLAWLSCYRAPGRLTGPITWQADPAHGLPAMLTALDAVPCTIRAHRG